MALGLLDHFRPPLSVRRHWHAFHNAWATYIASDLNGRLPEGYFAEPNVQFGIEIDVATFEEYPPPPVQTPPVGATAGGQQSTAWAPPVPTQTIPFQLATDSVEVLVYDTTAGPTLAGAIELVSPANKDRRAHRDAFVAKCETYLNQGVGLVVVDVVTARSANLHDALVEQLLGPSAAPWQADLYAVAYRLVTRDELPNLDIWQETLIVGQTLPIMPLWLRGREYVPLDLGATYDRTCREQRVG